MCLADLSADRGKNARYTYGFAGIAQLVERNLAKVEVESSRLFSRSKCEDKRTAFNQAVLFYCETKSNHRISGNSRNLEDLRGLVSLLVQRLA